MPVYLSPGVYVEEIESGSAPIAGVGLSTAGFIGVIDLSQSGKSDKTQYIFLLAAVKTEKVGETSEGKKVIDGETTKYHFPLSQSPVYTKELAQVAILNPPPDFQAGQDQFKVFVGEDKKNDKAADFKLINDPETGQAGLEITAEKLKALGSGEIFVDYQPIVQSKAGEVLPCTNFTEFKKYFGDFSPHTAGKTDTQNTLAHAVYGFFRNGGTRCFVTWVPKDGGKITLQSALTTFEAIDEIAIVAAPGVTAQKDLNDIVDHCQQTMQDRFAILDGPEKVQPGSLSKAKFSPGLEVDLIPSNKLTLPGPSDYAALYYPWLQVYDPVAKANIPVPPSGYIAGIYARTDGLRGIHKAPANEPVVGAAGLTDTITKRNQDALNSQGVNCIRNLNGSTLVWGARTWGGNGNGEFTYINIRRLFIYLRKSIDQGTQWTVFEPNTPELWAKIRRNVTAFLTNTWSTGALFGTSPEEAFYVKCDAENNPPDVRDRGQVVIEIGVAPTKPAEFVIFRLSQWAGPGGS